MNDFKLIKLGILGYSLNQILGILLSGYQFNQSIILFLILILISLIPGFIRYGIMQRESFNKIESHKIFSCFIPSLILILIISIGFFVGFFVAI